VEAQGRRRVGPGGQPWRPRATPPVRLVLRGPAPARAGPRRPLAVPWPVLPVVAALASLRLIAQRAGAPRLAQSVTVFSGQRRAHTQAGPQSSRDECGGISSERARQRSQYHH